MGYTNQADLVALLESAKVEQALDDANVGAADSAVFASIQAAVENEINGYLESRFPIPLRDPVPAFIKDADLILKAELLYARRGVSGQNNPWSDRADKIRDRLAKIRDGAPLSVAMSSGSDAGGIVSEPSVTYSPGRSPL